MKIQIRESARSTADRPLFVWHVFTDGGSRPLAFGFADSEAQAQLDASAAAARIRRERQSSWITDLSYLNLI